MKIEIKGIEDVTNVLIKLNESIESLRQDIIRLERSMKEFSYDIREEL